MLDQAALPFLSQRGHIVSLVGGGGKTTLLYQMSAHCGLYHHPYPLPAGRALGTGCVPAGWVVGGWNVRCGGKASCAE